jgi:Fur family transcriptional regulator, ferric uptake regulator
LPTSARRQTRQRGAIWDVLSDVPGRHLSAEEIVDLVRERLPGVNTSTVYRTLDRLAEDGIVLRTDLGSGRAYYEPAREYAHHHVVCERCGAVAHLHGEALGSLASRIEAETGYALGAREISFFGVCPGCRIS